VADAIQLVPALWYAAQVAALSAARAVVDGIGAAVEAAGGWLDALNFVPAAWAMAQRAAGSALQFIVQQLANLLALMPGLPTWLGGGKESSWAGTVQAFADDLSTGLAEIDKAAAQAGPSVSQGALEGIRSLRTGIDDALAGAQKNLDAAEPTKKWSDSLGEWSTKVNDAADAAAKTLADGSIKGTAAAAAAIESQKDAETKKGKEAGETKAAERGSVEAYTAAMKGNLANRTADAQLKEQKKTNTHLGKLVAKDSTVPLQPATGF
ncbi:MAG: hypothetical protein ACRC1K_09065, partial [Planctomycetia bacterium]